jgi:hypothetical protein
MAFILESVQIVGEGGTLDRLKEYFELGSRNIII